MFYSKKNLLLPSDVSEGIFWSRSVIPLWVEFWWRKPATCRFSSELPPPFPLFTHTHHLLGFRGKCCHSEVATPAGAESFKIFKKEGAFRSGPSPQTAPKKDGFEAALMVVVTPSPSSGEPGKLSPQQPSRSKPASVGRKPTTMEQLTPKPPTNSYPVDPNLCYPVNKFNSTRFLLETPLLPITQTDTLCVLVRLAATAAKFRLLSIEASWGSLGDSDLGDSGLLLDQDQDQERDIEGDTVWPAGYRQCSDRLSLAGSDLLWWPGVGGPPAGWHKITKSIQNQPKLGDALWRWF